MRTGSREIPKTIVTLAVVVSALWFGATAVRADDLQGAEVVLCSASMAHKCTAAGGCESGAVWDYNIPTFVELDLAGRVIRTTEASHEQRSSPLSRVDRDQGVIYLQGIENGRAFSAVIDEELGLATFSIAAHGIGISVFGVCTPLATEQR